jgi:hypothetical protein
MDAEFVLDSWHGTHDENKKFTIYQDFTHSKIRPYGKWFDERIVKKIGICKYLCGYSNGHFGFLQTSKEKILSIPIEVLHDWLIELIEVGPNGELPHYWERSWASIFSY